MSQVDELAAHLRVYLETSSGVLEKLHIHGAQSSAIQALVGELLVNDLGFETEIVLSPQDGLVTRARPDFYFSLAPDRGLIAEIERGGTTANNHDLKDLWKTHLAPDAHHLFLVVPLELRDAQGRVRERPFPKVARRLGAFFGDERREIHVLSVHIFGY